MTFTVTYYDEEENKGIKNFFGLTGREKAMEFANKQRWATINISYS